MSELVVDFITTLDGYASGEGWPGWWGLEGPEYFRWLETQPERHHSLLMGATTYRVMSGFTEVRDDLREDESESVDELARADKIVVSNTLEEPLAWPNTELIRGDAVEAVRRLKAKGGPLPPHHRQPEHVPVAASGRARGPVPRGDLPGHHRCHRQ